MKKIVVLSVFLASMLGCIAFWLQPAWAISPAALKAAKQATDSHAAVPPAETVTAQTEDVRAQKLGGNDGIDVLFYQWAGAAAQVKQMAGRLFCGGSGRRGSWAASFSALSNNQGPDYFLLSLLLLAVIMGCSVLLERMVNRFTEGLRDQILDTVTIGPLRFMGRVLTRFGLDAVGIGVFMVTSFALFVIFLNPGSARYHTVSILLITSYYFRVVIFAAKVVLSPQKPAIRLLPLEDQDAVFLYRWLFRMSLAAAVFAGIGALFETVDQGQGLYLLNFCLSGLSVIVMLVIMIWQSRSRVAQAILPEAEASAHAGSLRQRFAANWHVLAMVYIIFSGTIWIGNVLINHQGAILNLLVSVFVIPIFIGLEKWLQKLLLIASGETRQTIDLTPSADPAQADALDAEIASASADHKREIKYYIPLIRRAFRVFLILFMLVVIMRLWDIYIPFGWIFTSHLLSALLTLLLGFIVWEFAKAQIDRKLKEEMPDEDEEMEEGGRGGSRSGTLLVLLKKFILTVLLIIVGLTVLSSLGVDIAPLIAGAGVFGLAIGFGAQTLVKDIIAGIFFLLDDAFRVGDYIEAGGVKGSVEHISLRSMKLRHPRGMVHTVPFGRLGSVTNFSRDYIITKLNIRVRYESDIDTIRKIIKKIDRSLRKDKTIDAVLLGKIKSQGVKAMDDSAMIVRVKFKTLPGKQFVIRREVYQRIQKMFRENGIEFAHRNVTVYLPEDAAGKGVDRQKLAEAGAAAAALADNTAGEPEGLQNA